MASTSAAPAASDHTGVSLRFVIAMDAAATLPPSLLICTAAAAVAAFEASKIAAAAPRAEFFGFRSRELLEEVVAAINEARGDDWVQD